MNDVKIVSVLCVTVIILVSLFLDRPDISVPALTFLGGLLVPMKYDGEKDAIA